MATFTFEVDKVKRATASCRKAGLQAILTNKIQVNPESHSKFPEHLDPVDVGRLRNSFVGAVHAAYHSHYPLVLSPDMIWQCVAQGFAIHVNKNAEKLRHLFVAHEGKKKIVVRRDEFVKGSPDNDWEGALGDFSEEIRKNVGNEIHGILTPEFSTTGPVERAAAQVVMMDAFKEYFEYMCMTMCGIPEITLEGTVEDWKKLREKALSLARFDLQWWIDPLKPILDEFVNAASGKITKKFWQSIYKISDGSGGPYITGWVVTLFPYLGRDVKKMHTNSYLKSWGTVSCFHGVTTDSFPSGSVSTPFTWQYFAEEFEMYFYAGFLGVGQDKKSLSLQPVIGWAVVDKEEEEKAKMTQRRAFW